MCTNTCTFLLTILTTTQAHAVYILHKKYTTRADSSVYLDILSFEIRHRIGESATHVDGTHRCHVLRYDLVTQTDPIIVLQTNDVTVSQRALREVFLHIYNNLHVSIQTVSAGHHQHAVKSPAKPVPKCFPATAIGGITEN